MQVLVVSVTLLSASYLVAGPVVLNGGFEAGLSTNTATCESGNDVANVGAPTNWSFVHQNGSSAAASSPFPSAPYQYNQHGGSCFAFFSTSDGGTGDNGYIGLTQNITGMTIGDTETLTYWVQEDYVAPNGFYATWSTLAPVAFDPVVNHTAGIMVAGSAFEMGQTQTDYSFDGTAPGFCGDGTNTCSYSGGGAYTKYTLSLGTAGATSMYLTFFGDEGNTVGNVTLDDISIAETAPEGSAVPEPTTLLLLGSGLLAMTRRLRRTS